MRAWQGARMCFFSSRRRHTRYWRDWSSDVCSSDLEFGVFSELRSHKITAEEVRAINPIGIVLSGGPNSVYADNAFGIDEEIFELGIPILGICYGMQLLTDRLGGKVVPAGQTGNSEYGQSTL